MNQPNAEVPTPLQQAEYAAHRFAQANYHDCSAWTVVIRRTYGVRSLLKDLKSDLVRAIVDEKSQQPIGESIEVIPDQVGFVQLPPQETYLIAQSLPLEDQSSQQDWELSLAL